MADKRQVPDEIRRVYEKQKANRWRLANSTAKERARKLHRLSHALLSKRVELHEAIYQDFGKNPGEADLTEIYAVISEINHTIKHLAKWMRPRRVRTPKVLFGSRSEIRYEPKGLVLILSPWNYPVNLCINPLVAAIAAGNAVILKPSSKVPHTAQFLGQLIAGLFPEEEVALFQGSADVSNDLLSLEFDHIVFTGSPRVGKTVMAAAAEHLTPLLLELGGKSPVVVDESADIGKAAERIMWGKYLNAGQTCVAPDYLMIHESRLEAFVAESKAVLEARYGKSAEERKNSDSLCRLVSEKNLKNLKDIMDATIDGGAKLAFGGAVDLDARYMEPTLLTDVTFDSPIMADEIFGPVLPIISFGNLDEPIRAIQRQAKPLALYIFSRRDANVERLLRNTTSGGTCINSLIMHLTNPNLPFGGVGQSGMGSYHGLYGFRTLSHERAVFRQGIPDTLKLFYPPYTASVKQLILKAIKYFS